MAYTSKSEDGHCMRCSWPEYRTPVATFYLSSFQARLCVIHARELVKELTNWLKDSQGGPKNERR